MLGSKETQPAKDIGQVLSGSIYKELFPPPLELLPQVNEAYELELAFYESRILHEPELVRNGAYFARVGDRLTRHFLMCSGEPIRLPQHSSSRLRSFFRTNQFKTGYATHGLFPYRGKFHPQMVKGLINAMGLNSGDTILDPMMGSGTVLIEAMLMGIHSIGVDASPFCRFMTQAKLDGLKVPLTPIRSALEQSKSVFEYFSALSAQPNQARKMRFEGYSGDLFSDRELDDGRKPFTKGTLPEGAEVPEVYNFLLLAYLDSAGYSERSNRKTPYEQFRAILERYLFVAEKIQLVLAGAESELGNAQAIEGDARSLPCKDSTIDGIVFSPPYSFAIDYLDNDSFHLRFLKTNIEELRERMIGLRGRTMRQKFALYKSDLDKVLSECARVLRRGRICAIVVGTNNNQLGKILETAPDAVQGIDELLVEIGSQYKLHLVRKIARQITGMANTMRNEFIVMLQKE
jgi:ubiquinone/menaquinone biosynthesis C-methylase UbiE